MRIAGAPISWGVCEAPGWGHEMPAARVLGEMRALGLTATELGPTGYLGAEPDQVRSVLAGSGMGLVGGFLPVPMHVDPDADLTEAAAAVATLAAAGSEIVVLAARSADGSYDRAVPVSEEQWPVLLGNLKRLTDLVGGYGMAVALHPHVGTAIENRAAVRRLLDSSDVPLCLDTGHLAIGGTDPVEVAVSAPGRVAHVHLKDVRLAVAERVRRGEVSYQQAIRQGLYAPLGAGDVDIAAVVRALESAGYDGWYVLEQDCALDAEPAAGGGPIADVRRSLDYLQGLSR